MRISKSKIYWIAFTLVMFTGIILILKLPQNGFLYAFIILILFLIIDYLVVSKIKRENK